MLTIRGCAVVFMESKDFGDRTRFDREYQYRTALRHAAAPRQMRALQAVWWRRWEHQRPTAARALVTLLQPLLNNPVERQRIIAQRRAVQWLEEWCVKAYRHGMRAAGITEDLSDADASWLDHEFIPTETQFITKFLKAIATNRCSPAMARHRARQYANTLDGVFYVALVSMFPLKGTHIEWKLGVAEHCPDCIALGRKQHFTPKTLPTTPRAGATRCLANCKCTLVVSFTPTTAVLQRTGAAAAAEGWETDDPVVKLTGIEEVSVFYPLLKAQA